MAGLRNTISVNGKPVCFSERGAGHPLVLLHGFAESMELWDDFTPALEEEFRVIAIDLPGHGGTGVFGSVHTMEFMADVVKLVLDHLGIKACVMIGHSMGGYVTLAFARKYPAFVRGIGLFHSHAAADTEEVRKNRVRTINIIYSDRTGFIRQFIPELFAPENVPTFQEEIEHLRQLALLPPPEGITAALRGMMDREDNADLLRLLKIPVLFIAGKKDSKIPLELVLQHASLADHTVVLILGKAGHMGLIEEKTKTLHAVHCFIRNAFGEDSVPA